MPDDPNGASPPIQKKDVGLVLHLRVPAALLPAQVMRFVKKSLCWNGEFQGIFTGQMWLMDLTPKPAEAPVDESVHPNGETIARGEN